MKKVLFTATVINHIKNFHLPYLKWFSDNGYEVHIACNGNEELKYVAKHHFIPIERSPYKIKNIKAFFELKKIIKKNSYDIIHCHTPMGGVLTRLAAIKSRKKGTKVIYTAHGFHFFKGAPIKNWILYYPVEKILSYFTDLLITINKEDYNIASEKFKSKEVVLINGVGVNLNDFFSVDISEKNKLRKKLGFDINDFILIYVAELSDRKNQNMIIKVIDKLKNKIPNIKLLLVGKGDLKTEYKKQIRNKKLNRYIDLLGYRNDVPELMKISDLAVSTSKQEGLPVNIMEAMASGLPLVVTNCRGNKDLVNDEKNGYITKINDINTFANKVYELFENQQKRYEFGNTSLNLIKKYSLDTVQREYINLYKELT